jgi:hypothetical protein
LLQIVSLLQNLAAYGYFAILLSVENNLSARDLASFKDSMSSAPVSSAFCFDFELEDT